MAMNAHATVRYFLSVDFEVLGQPVETSLPAWQTFAMAVVQYPTGQVLQSCELGHGESFLPSPQQTCFWDKHPTAKAYNHRLLHPESGLVLSRADAEARIVSLWDQAHELYSNLFVALDHIGLDQMLLDDILRRHNRRPLEVRRHGRNSELFSQSLCTWSYQLALKHVVGRSLKRDLPARSAETCHLARALQHHTQERRAVKHTPLFDTYHTLWQHFRHLQYVEQRAHASSRRRLVSFRHPTAPPLSSSSSSSSSSSASSPSLWPSLSPSSSEDEDTPALEAPPMHPLCVPSSLGSRRDVFERALRQGSPLFTIHPPPHSVSSQTPSAFLFPPPSPPSPPLPPSSSFDWSAAPRFLPPKRTLWHPS